MKIYTKTGDKGETKLFGGKKVRKDSLRIRAYGEVDELNAVLGMALVHCPDPAIRELLLSLQNDLFTVGGDLATPIDGEGRRPKGDPAPRRTGSRAIPRVEEAHVTRLETLIDRHDASLPPLTRFILPNGSPAGTLLHLARTVARRAERGVTALQQEETTNPVVLKYLNRLSDLLFVLARVMNHREGIPETHPTFEKWV